MISNSHKVKNLLAKPLASLANKGFGLPVIVLSLVGATVLLAPSVSMAHYSVPNIMSQANKYIENDHKFDDKTLNYQLDTHKDKDIGHVVNSGFYLDPTSPAQGCGIDLGLVDRVYGKSKDSLVYTQPTQHNANQGSFNYVALNVYSRLLGWDKDAPSVNAAAMTSRREGTTAGYLSTADKTATYPLAYPFASYFRILPSIYPAYGGLSDNGMNCGRFLDINMTPPITRCMDKSQDGKSKACNPQAEKPSTITQPLNFTAFVQDTCEDANGWCRDDSAHVDMAKPMVIFDGHAGDNENDYISWHFKSNPYYLSTNTKRPDLKDIWLAWEGQTHPQKRGEGAPNYDYAVIAPVNLKNGISKMQSNIGTKDAPVWVKATYNAGGNDITWDAGSNSTLQFQIKPLNKLTRNLDRDHIPADEAEWEQPSYQIRFFDLNGYPGHNGSIYEFKMHGKNFKPGTSPTNLGTIYDYFGEIVSTSANFWLMYAGVPGQSVGTGKQEGPAVKRIDSPPGKNTITITFPTAVLNSLKTISKNLNDLHPVLISKLGFSYDVDSSGCGINTCTYNHIPNGASYKLFANFTHSASNDLTLRKVNNISIDTDYIFNKDTTLNSNFPDINTTYSAQVDVDLTLNDTVLKHDKAKLADFTGIQDTDKNIVGRLFFTPTDTNQNISAIMQGCWLHTYFTNSSNNNHCYLYYTQHHQQNFNSSMPSETFKLTAPKNIGIDSNNGYTLKNISQPSVEVTPYNGRTIPQITQTIGLTYQKQPTRLFVSTRSMFFMIDPQSDSRCSTNVTVKDDKNSIELPEPNIISTAMELPTAVNDTLKLTYTDANCVAMFSNEHDYEHDEWEANVKPGTNIIEVIKLVAKPLPSQPIVRKITVQATATSACTIPSQLNATIDTEIKKLDQASSYKATYDNISSSDHILTLSSTASGSCVAYIDGQNLATKPTYNINYGDADSTIIVNYKGSTPPTPPSKKVTGDSKITFAEKVVTIHEDNDIEDKTGDTQRPLIKPTSFNIDPTKKTIVHVEINHMHEKDSKSHRVRTCTPDELLINKLSYKLLGGKVTIQPNILKPNDSYKITINYKCDI